MDCSLLGSSVHGIFQARVLEWAAIAFSLYLKMDKQQRPTEQHRESCLMICGSPDARGVWEKVNTCICMAKSLCCPPETITLLIGFTPIQNNMLKNVF